MPSFKNKLVEGGTFGMSFEMNERERKLKMFNAHVSQVFEI